MNALAPTLPSIIISETDHDRLVSLLDTELAARHARTAEVLRRELDRAEIVPTDQVPVGVVTMGAHVLYTDSSGTRAEVELAYPWDASGDGRRVSILSPLGASLIGLREGAQFDWRLASGRVHRVTVLSVTAAAPSKRRSGASRVSDPR